MHARNDDFVSGQKVSAANHGNYAVNRGEGEYNLPVKLLRLY